ncbi:serine hydrolase domain-containing protein [Neobacillus sp. D3-1R]|uniref:serine hydrolase domain-containing protein n=1 Tax=Neobacillus sp. D3-1R TaxID=3445778 RepID=UPI003FA09920
MAEFDWMKLEEFILNKMEEENIAGVSVGISSNGETIFQKGFGYRDVELQLPVTPETIFGIASVTKSFTALAIMDLQNQGLLSVQDSVIQYLPEFKLYGVHDMNSIKICHLLSHTTGVPPMERFEAWNHFRDHSAYLAKEEYELLGAPGEYFSYCNDTFLLLGAIIERITGKLFRRYMTNQLLERLEMDRSTFSLEELEKMDNVSVPYHFNTKLNKVEKVDWPKLGNFEVGGGIRSNVVDLLKYGQVYINGEFPHSQKMWEPFIQVGRNSYYGYALNVTPNYAGEFTLVQHGGGQPGVSSNFGFVPEKKLVVTVLTNVGGVSAGDIWLAAVNTALGLPIEHKQSEEPFYEMSVNEIKKFVGTYTSKEGGNTKILFEDGKLYVEMDDQKFDLRASGPDTLVLVKFEKPIKFYFNNSDKPWALFNGSRVLRRI